MPQDLELPYIYDETLTGLAIAYRPQGMIADKILTKVKVDSPDFKYHYYPKGQFLTVRDTEIGETGEPNEDNLKYEKVSSSASVYSHVTSLPVRYLQAKTSETNKEAKRVMLSKDILQLADEDRLAKLLRNTDNYKGNSKVLTAQNNFSHSNIEIAKTIEDCMDAMYKRPNKVIMSSKTLSKFRTAPQLLAAAHGDGDVKDGKVSMDFLKKEVFDVEEILVSEAKINTAKRGQAESLSHVWGNDVILLYVNENADIDCGLTFGQTAVYEDYSTQVYFKPERGSKGVKYYKTGDEHKHFITCPDCGFIIKNAFTF